MGKTRHRVTGRDKMILNLLADFGCASPRKIQTQLFKENDKTKNHFRRFRILRQLKLIDHVWRDDGAMLGYKLTAKGKKFLALGEDHDGGIASKSYRTDYYHDQTLIDVKGIFANCSAISDYKSEGKIRKEINQKLSSLLHWEKRGNIPDGYFHLKLPDRNLRVAIELELSDKSQKRYERIFRNHLLSKSWDLVIYLVRDETLKNYLLGLLQKSKDRDIQVRVSNMLNGIYFCELNDFLKNGLDVKLTNGRRELSFKELAQISE